MSRLSRMVNAIRGERVGREIDEELESHIVEAIEQGRDPAEARRAFGNVLRAGEESRDIRLAPWLHSLRSDAVFGWRQLMKHKATALAAIVSLGLAIGACTSAFGLIDAMLLRPLPVAEPERLYALSRHGTGFDGKVQTFDGWAYPSFQRMRAAVKGDAELIAVSYAERADVTYRSDEDMEKATVQYVSGWMFGTFGLRPAAGRLFTGNDDTTPGGHPYAVLSYDYWKRRFARDPQAIGRKFQMGERVFEIVGVGPAPFTGTETGTVTDIFLPSMMHPAAVHDDMTWHRTLARLKPGVAVEPVRQKLHATSLAFEEERAKGFSGMAKEFIDKFLAQILVLEPAASGISGMQHDYLRSLWVLGVLVGLVLLIACANIANLMTAQAAARARELALRVALGAGRWRLVQLVLVESAWVACLAAALGGLFAGWSAPFVVSRINPPDNPARLALGADWRAPAFGLALTLGVTLLFGLAPALRAGAVKPASALKGGADPHSRRRLMHALIAVQVAFCFVVVFVAGLFATTLQRLRDRPMGFSTERLLTLETVAQRARPPVSWDQLAQDLRAAPGVETVALSGWQLLVGNAWNGFVSVNGAPPGPVLAYFLSVSPGWMNAMKIAFVEGGDFRPDGTSPGVALVNETFARQFFAGGSPMGRTFAKGSSHYRVVGVVRDTPYRNLREPTLPVAFVPFHQLDAQGAAQPIRQATLTVRTRSANPLALGSTLRRAVAGRGRGFRVSNVRTEEELVRAQTIRERLLAMLGLFFAGVAILLAGIGLYGVLDYTVVQRRREIGIRMAIGAQAGDIARRVSGEALGMVLVGAGAGIAMGMALARYIEALLYAVKPSDFAMLALPAGAIVGTACAAALPAVIHAVRIDPVSMLRAD